MILKYNEYSINEGINIDTKNKKQVAILFTDIVGSSKLWKNTELEMANKLEDLSSMFDGVIKKYDGMVIKTIGDAYMVSFDTLLSAIECGIGIQEELKKEKIKVDGDPIKIRLGICYGDVYETSVKIQGYSLVDYLGNSVNTASRLESKVSEEGGVAFGTLTDDVQKDEIDELLKDYDVDLVSFSNKGDDVKRSARLLTDVQRQTHKNVKELKGVDKIDVYKIKI